SPSTPAPSWARSGAAWARRRRPGPRTFSPGVSGRAGARYRTHEGPPARAAPMQGRRRGRPSSRTTRTYGSPPRSQTPPPAGRVRVGEDQADVRESLLLLLSCRGSEARGAADGAEGLRLALQWRPDAVISDIGLPPLDGWRLAEEVRSRLGG